MPLRKFDDQRIGSAFRPIVFVQLLTQFSGLYTHRRIGLGIVIGRFPESFDADCIFLEILRFTLQGFSAKVIQKTLQNFARMKRATL